MSDIQIVLELPEELVEKAKAAGLLAPEKIAAWLNTELARKAAIADLRADAQKLRSLRPALTQAEIDEEIRAARTEQPNT